MTNDISYLDALMFDANVGEYASSSSDMIEVGVMQYDAETGFFI